MKRSALDKALQQAQKLMSSIEPDNVPSLQRNPEQLFEQSQRLAQRRLPDDRSKAKAQYLFAKRGFDAEKLQQRLESIDIKATYEPLEQIAETDLDSYLRHEEQLLINAAIEEAKRETLNRFNNSYSSYMESEWEDTKRELIEYFTQDLGSSKKVSRFMEIDAPEQANRARSAIAEEYCHAIADLNNCRITNRPFALINRFKFMYQHSRDRSTRRNDTLNCWGLLERIMGETNVALSDFSFRGTALYEKEYGSGSVDKPETKTRFLQGAMDFLESQYTQFVQNYIAENVSKAQAGGQPAEASRVKAYLNVIFDRRNQGSFPNHLERGEDGYPIWAVLYYCIRMGNIDEAFHVAQSPALQSFRAYLDAYRTNSMTSQLRDQIVSEFRKITRQSKDPYRIIVYNIVGKCDPTKGHSDVPGWSTEDWMWLKLKMISTVNPSSSAQGASGSTSLSLPQLQQQLRTYGPDHFKNPLLYFQVLLMTLQFEYALKYLDSNPDYHVEMVHFTLALYYYGCIHLPSAPTHQLFIEEKGASPLINVVRLVRGYVREYSFREPALALHYLYLIQDEPQRNSAIRDLVIESEDFDALVGELQPDGTRKDGLLARFVNPSQWKEIVSLAAQSCEENGKYDAAIKLFDISQAYDRVLNLAIKVMGKMLVEQGPERARIYEMAVFLNNKYSKDLLDATFASQFKKRVSEHVMHAFRTLLGLFQFFDLCRDSEYLKALNCMLLLDLLPFADKDVEKMVTSFKVLNDSIKRNFADILAAAMDCLVKLYQTARNSGSPPNYLSDLREKARSLVLFSGLVQFRMPGDTHSRLVRMEVSMT